MCKTAISVCVWFLMFILMLPSLMLGCFNLVLSLVSFLPHWECRWLLLFWMCWRLQPRLEYFTSWPTCIWQTLLECLSQVILDLLKSDWSIVELSLTSSLPEGSAVSWSAVSFGWNFLLISCLDQHYIYGASDSGSLPNMNSPRLSSHPLPKCCIQPFIGTG